MLVTSRVYEPLALATLTSNSDLNGLHTIVLSTQLSLPPLTMSLCGATERTKKAVAAATAAAAVGATVVAMEGEEEHDDDEAGGGE